MLINLITCVCPKKCRFSFLLKNFSLNVKKNTCIHVNVCKCVIFALPVIKKYMKTQIQSHDYLYI